MDGQPPYIILRHRVHFDLPLHAMMLATVLLQESASFQANAPVGTGIEWLTLGSVLVPAVLLVFLVYWGAQETV